MTTASWEKLGILFGPDGSVPWMRSHAQLPVAVPAPGAGGRFHVYFASRDENGRSHVGRATVALGDTPRLIGVERDPILSPGALEAARLVLAMKETSAQVKCIAGSGISRHRSLAIDWAARKRAPVRRARLDSES